MTPLPMSNGPALAFQVCGSTSWTGSSRLWSCESRLVMPPPKIRSAADKKGLPLIENSPAVLLNVNELMYPETSRRGVRRFVPAITMSAVPLWGGAPSGFQLLSVLQSLLLPPPSHTSPPRANVDPPPQDDQNGQNGEHRRRTRGETMQEKCHRTANPWGAAVIIVMPMSRCHENVSGPVAVGAADRGSHCDAPRARAVAPGDAASLRNRRKYL